MRAEYKSICVKFRLDDPVHVKAFAFLQEHMDARKSYADIIAELIPSEDDEDGKRAEDERIFREVEDVKHLCGRIMDRLSKGVMTTGADESIGKLSAPEKDQSEMTPPPEVANFILGMDDEDD